MGSTDLEELLGQVRRNPPHPGECLLEFCLCGRDVAEVAAELQVAAEELARVVRGAARVTPALAVAMETAGWGSAEVWMRQQAAYDLAQERLHQERAA